MIKVEERTFRPAIERITIGATLLVVQQRLSTTPNLLLLRLVIPNPNGLETMNEAQRQKQQQHESDEQMKKMIEDETLSLKTKEKKKKRTDRNLLQGVIAVQQQAV
jgi:hypothetical protein